MFFSFPSSDLHSSQREQIGLITIRNVGAHSLNTVLTNTVNLRKRKETFKAEQLSTI